MARIRTVKPEICTDEKFADCSTTARLLFILMQNFCDDGGVHPAKPRTLKAEVFPMDDLGADAVQDLVDELIRAKLLDLFEVDGQQYWHVRDWKSLQKIEKPSQKYPSPPIPTSTTTPRTLADASATTTRTVDDASPPEGKEGNGKEGEDASSTTRPADTGGTADDRQKGSHLPKNWTLPDDWARWAEQERHDLTPKAIASIADEFRDHWLGKPGKEGRKADWQATWRNWIRREKKFDAHRGGGKTGSQPQRFELGADEQLRAVA